MLTLFLFVKQGTQDEIESIRLDLQGEVDQPLKARSWEEIRTLQENAKVIVVLPTAWCSIHEVELPWLAERKAREAIPFALEDQLAQSLSALHFAFDRAHYHGGRYGVVAIDKGLLSEWLTVFRSHELAYDVVTIDWCALSDGEGCVLDHSVLVNAAQFKGTLSIDIWEKFPHDWADELTWHAFADSAKLAKAPSLTPGPESSGTWLAKHLLQNKMLNLCQGEFQHDTSLTQVKRWYQLAGVVAGVWLLSFLGIQAGLLAMMSHQNTVLDQQIETSYHVFFPQARQVVSPKIRITQLLKQQQSGSDAVLWSLVERLSDVLAQDHPALGDKNSKNHSVNHISTVQALQFQNQALLLVLACDSFSALEKIEAALKQAQVHVQQISAATEGQQVMAKLELKL